MNFGVRGHDIDDKNIKSLCRKLNELGINNIQLALSKSMGDENVGRGCFSPGYASYIKGELDKNNIRVSVLGSYINPIADDENILREQIEIFKENIKYAKYIGADVIGTETGMVDKNNSLSRENNYKILVKTMTELVSTAEKMGVIIGIEPVACLTINDAKMAKRLLDDLNSPNVFIIFDPVNLLDETNYRRQHEIFDDFFDILRDKITVVHLKDFVIENNEIVYKVSGEGILDHEYLFKLIKKNKPHIDMIFEELNYDTYNAINDKYTKMFMEA